MHELWVDNYYTMRDHILCTLPYPMRVLLGLIIYRKTLRTLHGQGTGRHTVEEMEAFTSEIWEGINDVLTASRANSTSDTPFWVLQGETPSEADATVYGFIVAQLVGKA